MWNHGIVIPKSKVQIINRKLVGVSGGRGTAQHLRQRARVSGAGGLWPPSTPWGHPGSCGGEEQYFDWDDKRQQGLLLGSYY